MSIIHGLSVQGNEVFDLTATDEAFISRASSSANFTFSGRSIGAADNHRIVIAIVAIYGSTVPSITSVFIGGGGATSLANITAGGSIRLAMFGLAISSGSTASIDVDISGSATACGVTLYKLLKKDVTSFSPVSIVTDTDTTGNTTITSTLTCLRQNPTILAAKLTNNSGGINWTSDEVNEDYLTDINSNENFSCASGRLVDLPIGTHSITSNNNSGSTALLQIGAIWS